MIRDRSAWVWYLVGAFLTLVWKWARWVRTGMTMGNGVRQSTREWLDVSLLQDRISWATTVGIVWTVGSVAIDKAVTGVGVPWIDRLLALPMFDPAAFLLGTLMEFLAPALAKWALSKIPQ